MNGDKEMSQPGFGKGLLKVLIQILIKILIQILIKTWPAAPGEDLCSRIQFILPAGLQGQAGRDPVLWKVSLTTAGLEQDKLGDSQSKPFQGEVQHQDRALSHHRHQHLHHGPRNCRTSLRKRGKHKKPKPNPNIIPAPHHRS